MAFSPDGKKIAWSSEDDNVQLWDVETQSLTGSLEGHDHWVRTVAFSPDGSQLVSGSDDHTVRIWDVETRLPIGDPFLGHTDIVYCVAFFPDGKQIVSTSRDGTLRVWDIVKYAPCGTTDPASNSAESEWLRLYRQW